MKSRGWSALALAVALAGALAPLGCRTEHRIEAQRSEELLGAAGFRSVRADTPERAAALRRLPPRTVTEVLRGERTYYPPAGCSCRASRSTRSRRRATARWPVRTGSSPTRPRRPRRSRASCS